MVRGGALLLRHGRLNTRCRLACVQPG